MRVFIFDINGNVVNKFTCSKYLEFPNGVCCNDKQEIFISDNRAHCIKVFSYEGHFLRTIGSEGVTNYPIGVVQNSQGDVLIADNHNNFNLTIFTQGKILFSFSYFIWFDFLNLDGQLINALESKVKHAQCFDVALTDDGSVVLASKDYRIYVYRYLMTPSLMTNGTVNGNTTDSSSPSTTPNSSQMINGECASPSFLNDHSESPIITNNGYWEKKKEIIKISVCFLYLFACFLSSFSSLSLRVFFLCLFILSVWKSFVLFFDSFWSSSLHLPFYHQCLLCRSSYSIHVFWFARVISSCASRFSFADSLFFSYEAKNTYKND